MLSADLQTTVYSIKKSTMINYKEKLHDIKAFVFDFDGVMTDGNVWTYADGETVRCGNIKDGFAIQYAVKKGYVVALISGATSLSIDNRMAALGVKQCFTGCANKMKTYRDFLSANGLEENQVVCMGDDIPDYEIMSHCGVAACPADAATEIKQISDYISLYGGGRGCVRDIIEQVMRLQGKWFDPSVVNHEAMNW
jgi:3-deoxy-D-manno-octulosonate 8-phosphate phosphatase (KDO 8-P phosphatase)